MPLPKVIFNKEMSLESRGKTLEKLEKWLDSEEVSAVKRQVMFAVLHYANKNLIEFGPDKHMDLSQFATCNAIFTHAELPDLLFLKYVINQMDEIADETSELKKAVLPMTQNYKRPLMLALIKQVENASLLFGLATLFMRNPGIFWLKAVSFFANGMTTEAKIEEVLNERLARLVKSGGASRLDESLNAVARLAYQGRTAFIGFFNRARSGAGTDKLVLSDPGHTIQPKR